jgi:hypothetical protein
MAGVFETLATLDLKDPSQPPQLAMMQSMRGLQALSWLVNFGSYFVTATLLCAAYRATLRPGEGGFAFLRVGRDELNLFLLMLIVAFGGGIALVFLMLIVGVIVALLIFLTQNTPAISILLGFVAVLGTMGALIYVAVRLSMMFPLSFIRRKLVIDQAWAMTRDRFWILFPPYLAIAVLTTAVASVICLPLLWSIVAGFASQLPPPGSDPDQARAAMGTFVHYLASQAWTLAAVGIAMSAINGISFALYGGAMATAARGFLLEDGQLPEELREDDEV